MFSKSPTLIALLLGVFASTADLASFAKAGEKAGTITVTGCLQEGNMRDRFTLTAHGGKTYALRSASVKLADHVGHSITIKGDLKRDPKRDDYDFEGSEVKEGYGKDQSADQVDVEVTNLKMNSPSCPVASRK